MNNATRGTASPKRNQPPLKRKTMPSATPLKQTPQKKKRVEKDILEVQQCIQSTVEQTPFKVLSQIKFMVKPHERIVNTFRLVLMLYNHFDPVLGSYFTFQNISWREISRILPKINLPLLLLSYPKLLLGKHISIQQLNQCESLLAKCHSQEVDHHKELNHFCTCLNTVSKYTILYLHQKNISSETTKESVSTNTLLTSSQLVKQSESDEEEAEEPMNLKVEMEDLNKSLEKHPSAMKKTPLPPHLNSKKSKVEMILRLKDNHKDKDKDKDYHVYNQDHSRSKSILKSRQKQASIICPERSVSKSNVSANPNHQMQQSFSENQSTQRNTSSKKSVQRVNDHKVSQWSASKDVKKLSGQKLQQSTKCLAVKKSNSRFK